MKGRVISFKVPGAKCIQPARWCWLLQLVKIPSLLCSGLWCLQQKYPDLPLQVFVNHTLYSLDSVLDFKANSVWGLWLENSPHLTQTSACQETGTCQGIQQAAPDSGPVWMGTLPPNTRQYLETWQKCRYQTSNTTQYNPLHLQDAFPLPSPFYILKIFEIKWEKYSELHVCISCMLCADTHTIFVTTEAAC